MFKIINRAINHNENIKFGLINHDIVVIHYLTDKLALVFD